MAYLNKVFLIGNLTRDPEMKSTAGGMSIMSLRLAFNERKKNNQTGQWEDAPNYVDVTLFGNRAEAIDERLRDALCVIHRG